MKVLYIIPYDSGGMQHYTSDLANAMSNYAEVRVIGSNNLSNNFNDKVKLLKIFRPVEFSSNYLKILLNYKNLKAFYSFKNISIIKEINPDVIHFTTPLLPPLIFFIKLNKLDTRYNVIYTKHSVETNSGLNKLFEFVTNYMEKVLKIKMHVLHTEKDKLVYQQRRKTPDNKIAVIPHGVYSMFRNNNLHFDTEKNTILFFGRITPYKGLEYALNALPIVTQKIPDIKLTIAGDGDLSPYRKLINEIDDNNNINIINGYINDEKVSELFEKNELIILPYSSMSGQSGVINIACAFGKPIIASDVGSFKDIVINKKTGILVPPKNSIALGEAIIKLLSDDQLKREMSINLLYIAKEISWDNVAKRHLELYEKVNSGT